MKFNFKLEEIKYGKILCKDKNDNPYSRKLAIKSVNETEIIACARYEEEIGIEAPQEATLSIICSDGLYRTKTTLKSIEKDEPYVFFSFKTPQGIEYEQNREYFRVPVDFNCIYKIRENGNVKEFNVRTADISASGISIVVPMLVVSELADIVIALSGKLVQASVRYVRSEKVSDGYRLSFAYTKISETDRDYISQVCLQKQLEERRNSLR